jgi:hypothetical protein
MKKQNKMGGPGIGKCKSGIISVFRGNLIFNSGDNAVLCRWADQSKYQLSDRKSA